MSPFDWFDSTFCVATVCSLAHFVWQGTLISLVVVLSNALMRRASSQARYAFSLAALCLMAACIPITFSIVRSVAAGSGSRLDLDARRGGAAISARTDVPDPTGLADGLSPVAPATVGPVSSPSGGQRSGILALGSGLTAVGWHRYAPQALTVYVLGVAAFLARFLVALRGGQRLRRGSQPVDDSAILTALARQARALRLSFTPPIAYCRRVVCPTVVGVIRPTILLPISILSGLTPDQVEVLLAHELAHIRRCDHLINTLQRLIEAFLFFHPGVWYVSRRIRVERENCCDDMVLPAGSRPTDYATSLLRLAEIARSSFALDRGMPTTVALGAYDRPSQLRIRVSRLLGGAAHHPLRLGRTGFAVMVLAIGMAWAAASFVGAQTRTWKGALTAKAREQEEYEAFQRRFMPLCRAWRRTAREGVEGIYFVIDTGAQAMWIERNGSVDDSERIGLMPGLTWEIYHLTPSGKTPLTSPVRLNLRSTPSQDNVTQEFFKFLGREGQSERGCSFEITRTGNGCGLHYPTTGWVQFGPKRVPPANTPIRDIVDRTMLVTPEEYEQNRRAATAPASDSTAAGPRVWDPDWLFFEVLAGAEWAVRSDLLKVWPIQAGRSSP